MFPKVCIYIRKVTSMVKYFTEVRKTSEDIEVCPLLTSSWWCYSSIWCSRRIVACRTAMGLLRVGYTYFVQKLRRSRDLLMVQIPRYGTSTSAYVLTKLIWFHVT